MELARRWPTSPGASRYIQAIFSQPARRPVSATHERLRGCCAPAMSLKSRSSDLAFLPTTSWTTRIVGLSLKQPVPTSNSLPTERFNTSMPQTPRPRFGIATAPQQVDYVDILRVWREADSIPEIEHAWLFDHLLPIRGDKNGPIY